MTSLAWTSRAAIGNGAGKDLAAPADAVKPPACYFAGALGHMMRRTKNAFAAVVELLKLGQPSFRLHAPPREHVLQLLARCSVLEFEIRRANCEFASSIIPLEQRYCISGLGCNLVDLSGKLNLDCLV